MKTTVTHPTVVQKTGENRSGSLKTNVTNSVVAENASELAVIPKNGSNQKGSFENSKEKQMDPTTATDTVTDAKNANNGSQKTN